MRFKRGWKESFLFRRAVLRLYLMGGSGSCLLFCLMDFSLLCDLHLSCSPSLWPGFLRGLSLVTDDSHSGVFSQLKPSCWGMVIPKVLKPCCDPGGREGKIHMLSVCIGLLSMGSPEKSHSSPVLLPISLRRRPGNLLKALLLYIADERCHWQCGLGTDALGFPHLQNGDNIAHFRRGL